MYGYCIFSLSMEKELFRLAVLPFLIYVGLTVFMQYSIVSIRVYSIIPHTTTYNLVYMTHGKYCMPSTKCCVMQAW